MSQTEIYDLKSWNGKGRPRKSLYPVNFGTEIHQSEEVQDSGRRKE